MPYRRVNSWACVACGRCCRKYRVRLQKEEAVKLAALYPNSVQKKGNKLYLAKPGGKCVFQYNNLCSLQDSGLKPLACKVWPFYLSLKPIKEEEFEESLYIFDEKRYFLYINPFCQGFNKGTPYLYSKVIDEIIELYKKKTRQRFSTAHLPFWRGLKLLSKTGPYKT